MSFFCRSTKFHFIHLSLQTWFHLVYSILLHASIHPNIWIHTEMHPSIQVDVHMYLLCTSICPFSHLSNYSFIHSSIHPSIHSFIHPFIHPSIHSFVRSFVRSFIHSFVYWFIHPSIHPSIHSFVRSFIRSFFHSFVHSFIHSFSQSFSDSFINSFMFYSFIHVLVCIHVPSVFNLFDRPFLRSFVNTSIDLSSLESIRWSINVGMFVCISTCIYICTFLHTYSYMYIFVNAGEAGREWEMYVSKLHPLRQSLMMNHTHAGKTPHTARYNSWKRQRTCCEDSTVPTFWNCRNCSIIPPCHGGNDLESSTATPKITICWWTWGAVTRTWVSKWGLRFITCSVWRCCLSNSWSSLAKTCITFFVGMICLFLYRTGRLTFRSWSLRWIMMNIFYMYIYMYIFPRWLYF